MSLYIPTGFVGAFTFDIGNAHECILKTEFKLLKWELSRKEKHILRKNFDRSDRRKITEIFEFLKSRDGKANFEAICKDRRKNNDDWDLFTLEILRDLKQIGFLEVFMVHWVQTEKEAKQMKEIKEFYNKTE